MRSETAKEGGDDWDKADSFVSARPRVDKQIFRRAPGEMSMQLFVLLVVTLAAGCATGVPTAWVKPGASEQELADAKYACMRDSRVGNVVPSEDNRVFAHGSNKVAQTDANRLYKMCMESKGWHVSKGGL
jgi:hypothetical protein